MQLLAFNKKWWHFLAENGSVVEISREKHSHVIDAMNRARQKVYGE